MLELRNIIDEAKKAWLGKTQSEKTKVAYSNDLHQFLEFHGINPTHIDHMTRILPEQVTSWRDHLKREGGRVDAERNPQPAANSTIARKMTALRSFFSFLQNYGLSRCQAHRAKVPLVDIQHWLGHKDPRTTLRYIRGVEDVDNSPAYILRYV
jgi:site-specific recombinase XerD